MHATPDCMWYSGCDRGLRNRPQVFQLNRLTPGRGSHLVSAVPPFLSQLCRCIASAVPPSCLSCAATLSQLCRCLVSAVLWRNLVFAVAQPGLSYAAVLSQITSILSQLTTIMSWLRSHLVS
jgi:hypothetical protein